MTANQSKAGFLYGKVRCALRSGGYVPGQRIDPTTIAEEFNFSATPVRLALYRLVGEGLIADHARTGLYVPLPTEVALREQFDWMQRLLLMACDIAIECPPAATADLPADTTGKDVARLTWQLFDGIACAADHKPLHQAIEQSNDRLAPVRPIGQAFVDDAAEELAELIGHWRERDLAALKAGLRRYHERRKQLVPDIVAAFGDAGDFLH